MDTRVHISLEVANLDAAVTFYSRLFQCAPTKRKSDYANFRMESPQLHLALVLNPKRAAEPAGSRHYGIELFADEKLNEWLGKAKGSGLETRIEEETTCCYAVANKFWARDPDGHEWEFWVRHDEAESMHDLPSAAAGASGTDESTCCAPEPAKATQPVKASACCAPGKC